MRGFVVSEIAFADARAFLAAQHYLGAKMPVSRWRYGLHDEAGVLRGVAVFGEPSRQTIAPSLLQDVQPGEVLELGRFALADWPDRPPNLGSWFLAQCLGRVPGTLVVTYADPAEGHHGGLYQAAGALYLGRGKRAQYFYRDPTGHRVHARGVWEKAKAAGLQERQLADQMGLSRVETVAKHRYVFLLQKAARARLLIEPEPYPKGVTAADRIEIVRPPESAADWEAVALAIEWEGTIGVYCQRSPKSLGGVVHRPVVTVSQSSPREALLGQLKAAADGLGAIGDAKETPRPNRARKWSWQAETVEDAVRIAKAVRPFLVTKGTQADLVAGFPVGRHGVKLTPEVFADRQRRYEETLGLNATGPRVVEVGDPLWWLDQIPSLPDHRRMLLLARSMEWEGCFSISRTPNDGARGISHGAGLSISQVAHRRSLLVVVQALAGGAGQIAPTGRAVAPEGQALMLNWQVLGHEAVILAKRLLPYLTVKRRQGELVAAFPIGESGERLTDEVFTERERLYEELRGTIP